MTLFFLLSASAMAIMAAALGVVNELRIGDAELVATGALPDGATSSVSNGFYLGAPSTQGAFLADEFELVLSAPALNSSQLPNGATMTYSIVTGSNADLTVPSAVVPNILVQTGAGGVGAAAATMTSRLPSVIQDYVGFKAVNSGAGDASGAIATLQAKF